MIFLAILYQKKSKGIAVSYASVNGGTRKSFGVLSNITGYGGNWVIINDLVDAKNVGSKVAIDKSIELINQLSTRSNNFLDVKMIYVSHHVDYNDAQNYLIKNFPEQWDIIKIPLIYDKKIEEKCKCYLPFKDKRSINGAILNKARFNQNVIDGFRKQLGTYNFAAQCQQNPYPRGGSIIKGSWFKISDTIPPLDHISIFVDTATTTKTSSDYTAFGCFGISLTDGRLVCLEIIRDRWLSGDLISELIKFAKKWYRISHEKPATFGMLTSINMETKMGGITLLDTLKRELLQFHNELALIPVAPTKKPVFGSGSMNGKEKDKFSRVSDFLPFLESGSVVLVEGLSDWRDRMTGDGWIKTFIREAEEFTNNDSHDHDDMIDVMTDSYYYFYEFLSILNANKLYKEEEMEQAQIEFFDNDSPLDINSYWQ